MTEQRILLHTCRIPVRWGDMDAYGHVNNTIYFRYCEQARVEWLEQGGFMVSLDQSDGPVIINAACTFMTPVTYPATVLVRLYAGAPGRSSLMNWYEISVEGEDTVYAEGSAKVVWMNHLTGKSVPLPESLRKQFEN
ncbi:thioesterase family protein [Zoogloeaceae bacterium G21618-S1]|uniref:Acyl-CoA thioesterase n=1 Tax=Denitromonas halophila TaxID=1629404 RepID=A0A557QM54_9RHOO|nr:thioesterase family protein [Denitromonas halophila]MCZ4305474.1 thioesterase family protein [Zoogloeaceae bacterium G21618-S1]TVO53986.1 acyl-CoA thioesterase [Denitromonas halophila]